MNNSEKIYENNTSEIKFKLNTIKGDLNNNYDIIHIFHIYTVKSTNAWSYLLKFEKPTDILTILIFIIWL